MTRLDDKFVPLASRLINQFGKTATIAGQNVKVSPPTIASSDLIDGELVRRGDLESLVAGKDLPSEPDPTSDWLNFDGVAYRIVQVDRIYSGEDIAVYRLVVRR